MGDGAVGALGMTVPVVQAPIGGAATPQLAAAVSGAGGLGMLALSWSDPAQIRSAIERTGALTSRTFGANLVLDRPQFERLELCLAAGVRVISTFWGDPAPYSAPIHAAGALHLHTVASAAEARRAVAAGVDVVVAQGWEAGGHVWGEVGTLALVPAVVDAVHPVPVIAAGGIADRRGLAAVLALGAVAGWIGTRFLLAEESGAHPGYRAAVAAAAETDTLLSELFDGGWPDAPHRTLRNSTVREWLAAGSPPPGSRPGEGEQVAVRRGEPQLRYSSDIPTTGVEGDVEAMVHYAGQGVGLVRDVKPAAEIVRELVGGRRLRSVTLPRHEGRKATFRPCGGRKVAFLPSPRPRPVLPSSLLGESG